MSAERQRVLEMWNDYRAKVMPKDAHEIQVSECRRSFFAGAISTYNLCTGRDGSWKSEQEGMLILEDLQNELNTVAGRAQRGAF